MYFLASFNPHPMVPTFGSLRMTTSSISPSICRHWRSLGRHTLHGVQTEVCIFTLFSALGVYLHAGVPSIQSFKALPPIPSPAASVPPPATVDASHDGDTPGGGGDDSMALAVLPLDTLPTLPIAARRVDNVEDKGQLRIEYCSIRSAVVPAGAHRHQPNPNPHHSPLTPTPPLARTASPLTGRGRREGIRRCGQEPLGGHLESGPAPWSHSLQTPPLPVDYVRAARFVAARSGVHVCRETVVPTVAPVTRPVRTPSLLDEYYLRTRSCSPRR
jgi:hypothetical protein